MRPSFFSAAPATRGRAFSSATSPTTAIALPPIPRSRRRRLGFGVVRAHVDDDRGAARGQRHRDRAADVAPRAGDERDAAG